jgi:ubiquinone biosynthesis protein UbiJ
MDAAGADERFDRPGSPLQALIGEAFGGLQRTAVQALATALAHLLRQQAWARDKLRMHAGAVVRLGIDLPAPPAGVPRPELRLRIDAEGLVEPAGALEPVRATLLLKPSPGMVTDFSRTGVEGLARHLRVDGDVMLAASLGELARHLRWDAEEDLSRVFGDVAAHRLAGLLRAGLARIQTASAPAADRLVEQARGLTPGISRESLRELGRGFSALEDRLRHLEQRTDRLEAAR